MRFELKIGKDFPCIKDVTPYDVAAFKNLESLLNNVLNGNPTLIRLMGEVIPSEANEGFAVEGCWTSVSDVHDEGNQ